MKNAEFRYIAPNLGAKGNTGVNHRAKRVDLRATLLLIATSVGALII